MRRRIGWLAALAADPPAAVLIHDAARPCVTPALIARVLEGLAQAPGAAPALAVVDALWRGAEGRVQGTKDREGLWRAQTPQGFRFADLAAAHAAHPGEAADDVAVARAAGIRVVYSPALLPEGRRATLQASGISVASALAEVLLGTGVDVLLSRTGQAALVRRPVDAVEVSVVAAQLEQGGAGLAHVEDADEVAVRGEGGEHVRVEGRGGQAEQGLARAHAARFGGGGVGG